MAIAGFRSRDASGNIICDLTTRISRIIGIVYVDAGGSGSVSVPAGLGTPWAIPMLLTYPANAGPTISISGNTISWSYSSSNPTLQAAAHIMYGVY